MITNLAVDEKPSLINDMRLDARLSVSQPIWDTAVANIFNKSSNIKTLMRNFEDYISANYIPSSVNIDSSSSSDGI